MLFPSFALTSGTVYAAVKLITGLMFNWWLYRTAHMACRCYEAGSRFVQFYDLSRENLSQICDNLVPLQMATVQLGNW